MPDTSPDLRSWGVAETFGIEGRTTTLEQVEAIPYRPDGGRSWELIPPRMRAGLWLWVREGHPPGDFLSSLLENDFKRACQHADDTNAKILHDYAKFLWNWAPGTCWGRDKVTFREWARAGGVFGMERREAEMDGRAVGMEPGDA